MPKVRRSVFEEDNNFKCSTGFGRLTPVYVEEVLPGDKFSRLSISAFCRFAPLKLPVMHNIGIHQSSFFVPMRIIFGDDLYKKWLNNEVSIQPCTVSIEVTADDDPGDAFVNTIFDYLGYDPKLAQLNQSGQKYYAVLPLFNPIPYFGYLSIVQNWYMDSNLQATRIEVIDAIFEDYRACVEDGLLYKFPDISNIPWAKEVFNVAYSKDYFTTARPQPQKGSDMYVLNRPLSFSIDSDPADGVDEMTLGNYGASGTNKFNIKADDYENQNDHIISEETTIRDLWRKEMLQRFFEVDNTFGTRIREKLAGHFGVRFPNESLQIPRILGTSRSYTKVQEVVQTSESSTESYLGSYAGRATAADSQRIRPYTCVEHGFVIALVSFVPANGYVNGSPRWVFKQNFFDFASPEFNNIGWQDVFNGELYSESTGSEPLNTLAAVTAFLEKQKGTWGYQPRYSEYRSHLSRVAGNFRNNAELAWHLDRNFDQLPPLNENFISVGSENNRIFAGADSDEDFPLYLDVTIRSKMYRPISREPDSLHLY